MRLFLGITLHHGWLLLCLTAALVALTCLEASGSIVTRYLAVVNQSRSYSIFLLRALSELAGLSLAASLSATLERLNWALVCRRRASGQGSLFTKFLALQNGTGIAGLFVLGFGRSVVGLGTRVLALLRLVLLLFVPLIGILVMSQVDTKLAFSDVKMDTPYLGYGMQPINASMAGEFSGFTDLMFSWKFANFFGDASRSIDITPDGSQGKPCGLNAANDITGCRRTYFVPGEALLVAPELVANSSYPAADIVLASNHQGFVFDYDAGDSSREFDANTECRTYSSRYLSFQAGAVRWCVSNDSPNTLQARLVTCPGNLAATLSCTNDTSWYHNVDWTIKVAVSFRKASVAYSRSNGTILWHAFGSADPAAMDVPANVSSAQILEAYDAFLQDTTLLDNKPGSPPTLFSSSMFPTFLWLIEPAFSGVEISPSTIGDTVYVTLQALIAVPIYFCQSGTAMRLIPYALAEKSVQSGLVDTLFSVLSKPPPRATSATYANHRYELAASRGTLIAYLALSCAAILFCLLVHAYIAVRGWEAPALSKFPALDILTHCSVEDDQHRVLYRGHSATRLGRRKGNVTSWLSTLHVRWTQGNTEYLSLPFGDSELHPTPSSSKSWAYAQTPEVDSSGRWAGADYFTGPIMLGPMRAGRETDNSSHERLVRSPPF